MQWLPPFQSHSSPAKVSIVEMVCKGSVVTEVSFDCLTHGSRERLYTLFNSSQLTLQWRALHESSETPAGEGCWQSFSANWLYKPHYQQKPASLGTLSLQMTHNAARCCYDDLNVWSLNIHRVVPTFSNIMFEKNTYNRANASAGQVNKAVPLK